jgi:hypothetical protein
MTTPKLKAELCDQQRQGANSKLEKLLCNSRMAPNP